MIATGPGLPCPKCAHAESDVRDSRPGDGYIRRRRRCRVCATKWSTIEWAVEGLGHTGPEPVLRALQLRAAVDRLPAHKREIVLLLVAAFAADEVKT